MVTTVSYVASTASPSGHPDARGSHVVSCNAGGAAASPLDDLQEAGAGTLERRGLEAWISNGLDACTGLCYAWLLVGSRDGKALGCCE
eukprot:6630606-Pyramimonas_sp.AAC.1